VSEKSEFKETIQDETQEIDLGVTNRCYPPELIEGNSPGALLNRIFMRDSSEWIFDICRRIRSGENIYTEPS
jgi:hypothetical protein